ncbi:cAMP-specific 3',5'-cyclic phosphodiesterase 4D [Geranomyces variabilis]|nr:cAMP-specific 3',5'-cyclic phosphodiesterase 4D [Geranomyces variabilis]
MPGSREHTIFTVPLHGHPPSSPTTARRPSSTSICVAGVTSDGYQFPTPTSLSNRRSSVNSLPGRGSAKSSSRRASDLSEGPQLEIDGGERSRRSSFASEVGSSPYDGTRTSTEPLNLSAGGPSKPSGRAAAGISSSLKIWDVVLKRLRKSHYGSEYPNDQASIDYFTSKLRSQSTGSAQQYPDSGHPSMTPIAPELGGHVMSPALESFPFGEATLLNVMDAHLSAISNSFSSFTLTFHDPDVESTYERYFLDRTLNLWKKFAIISVLTTTILQTILVTKFSQPRGLSLPHQDFILVGALGLIPMTLLVLTSFYASKETLGRHIHNISLIIIWIVAPVLICGRYFISEEPRYTPSLTAPIYIFELVACVFFFRLRFLHTLFGVCIAAAPVWLLVFGIDAAKREDMSSMAEAQTEFAFAAVAVGMAALVICFISYDVERNLRLQYLSDQRFLSINVKLRKQLKGLQKGYESRIADLDSPLEKAIYGLRCLMANPGVGAEHLKTLTMIMSCLSLPNLLAPDLDQQVMRGQVQVDDEQEKWLFTQLARRKNISGDNSSESSTPEAQRSHWVFTSTASPYGRRDRSRSASPAPDIPAVAIEEYYTPETVPLLVRINEYNFPIFDFEQATKNRPLLVLSHHLVVQSGLLGRLQLPVDKFLNFMSEIEQGYNPELTFHNSIHATDVLHCIHYLISLPRLRKCFTDMEVLAFYIAAAIHDYDHPGVNNHFLIATSDPRALLYNDKSVLENHHCASAFKIMRRSGCDFAGGMPRKDYRGLREGIVEMVLATDLAQHFSLLAMFKKKVLTSEGFDPISTREDRTLLMQMLMKCSDVSNPTKSWPIYSTWIQRITEEFFSQGDKEKELGLPISPFCNREGAKSGDPSSSQKSFIEFIVAPLVEAVGEWVELGVIREGLEGSRERFGGGPTASGQHSGAKNAGLPTSPTSGSSTGVFLRRNRSVPGGLEAIGGFAGPASAVDHLPPLPLLGSESVSSKRRESWAGSIYGAVGEAVVARIGGSRRGSATGSVEAA